MSLRYDHFQRSRILKNHREIFNLRIGEGTQGENLYQVRKAATNRYKSDRNEREEKFEERRKEVNDTTKKLHEKRELEKKGT